MPKLIDRGGVALNESKSISARIVADSVSPASDRITTFVLCYPRFIHSEFLTARMFCRNSASSRAIPIERMIAEVERNPAMPVRWGKNGRGMQDHGQFTDDDVEWAEFKWRHAARRAVESAEDLRRMGLHKQVVNRVLEPFAWMETLVTATDWDNFYALRVHKDADPTFQRLAYLMLKAHVASVPASVEVGEWHLPFGDKMPDGITEEQRLKIACARAARLSYKTFDGETDVEKDYAIYEKLMASGHMSPLEHPATPCRGRCGPHRGWKSWRAYQPNENVVGLDWEKHLSEYEASIVGGRGG